MLRLRPRSINSVSSLTGRAKGDEAVFDRPMPSGLEAPSAGHEVDLHGLRWVFIAHDDGSETFLATADGVDGWIRSDLPAEVVRGSGTVPGQRAGPVEATVGDVTVRLEWTRPATIATLRRFDWVRSDDPVPRRVRSWFELWRRVEAEGRVIETRGLLGKLRVADDIDPVDLTMAVLAGRLF